jgi:hypothetical protein
MKKRSRLSMIGAGFAMALAALTGGVQGSQAYVNTPITQGQTSKDMKATPAKQARQTEHVVNTAGGLDLVQRGEYGMSPMQYGMRYGTGASRKNKSNRLRYSHNAKVANRG